MTVIVIDASSLAKYVLKEVNWIDIEDYLVKGTCSIDHIFKEVYNSIWKHTVIYKKFTKKEYNIARQILKRIVEEEIILIDSQLKYLDEAMDIAMENKITVYDSLYLAQALKYGELVTSDKRQAMIAEKLGIKTYYIR
jgi:predicted nucleic acid-binding protein